MQQPLFQVSKKHWPLRLFFTHRNKKSFGVKSEAYNEWLIKSMFWMLKNEVVWADVWELALSRWEIWLRRLVLMISWKTTSKQVAMYSSELTFLRCSSGTVATCSIFSIKQVTFCFQVLFAQTWFGSSWNTHTVLHVSKHSNVVLEYFLWPIDTSHFWTIEKLYVNNFFLSSNYAILSLRSTQ